ncbi:MAG: type II secretion system F family protein [Propionivibrio sp.]
MEAEDVISARQRAEAQGYRIIAAKSPRVLRLPFGDIRLGKLRFSIPLFAQELLALLDAGMGLVEAIDILTSRAKLGTAQAVLVRVRRQLGEGRTFSKALESEPATFPPIFVASAKSAEQTGDIREALRRYLAYHRQMNAARDKILAASIYPALLVVVGLLVVLFLMTYVVPHFSKIYEDIGGDRLPLLSLMLMHWGQWIERNMAEFALLATGSIVGMAIALSRPAVRVWLERTSWRMPLIGEQLRIYHLARFTRTLAMLQKGGIPLTTALDMTDDLLRQPSLRTGLAAAKAAIREGRAVSEAFGTHELATDVGTRLLVVGERSGELGAMLERIAGFYDDEIARTVELGITAVRANPDGHHGAAHRRHRYPYVHADF